MACFMLFRYCTAENSILATYYGIARKAKDGSIQQTKKYEDTAHR
jgi:hypothetical protein